MTVDKRIAKLNNYVKFKKIIEDNKEKMKGTAKKMLQSLYDNVNDICLLAGRLAENDLFPKEFLIDSRGYDEFGFDDEDILEIKAACSGLYLNTDENARYNLWDDCEPEKVILSKINIDSGENLPIEYNDIVSIMSAFYKFENEFYNWFDKNFGVISEEDKYKEQKRDLYERIEGIQSQIDDIDIEFSESIPDNIGDTPTDVGNMVSSISVLQTEISGWLDKHKDWV